MYELTLWNYYDVCQHQISKKKNIKQNIITNFYIQNEFLSLKFCIKRFISILNNVLTKNSPELDHRSI